MARRYDLAMSEPVVEQLSEDVQRIVQGYTFDEPAIELGALMENDAPVPPATIRIPLSILNRHGLVAGATGTGKTHAVHGMRPCTAPASDGAWDSAP
jgi:DNA helicase HerA-like ATPase